MGKGIFDLISVIKQTIKVNRCKENDRKTTVVVSSVVVDVRKH